MREEEKNLMKKNITRRIKQILYYITLNLYDFLCVLDYSICK